ncbi:cytochrome c biogenesis protein CcdA [Candidatus Nitrosotenuis chungbukensis]|uniref:cytochrome c biogenesis CcdA family protein n=1 Tax=Candidatus Nitrosotenuis chungbukensis TaxID=1353246 RepID=UPI002671285D|nr:cytochrome c biogenesis protein CcdA [Candidatus Nitrosotenuis chungbukensis]WKT57480.1 cytochrome c biogenesis protein CcdA [Candidatus Nitrosotenuis chungbukensis]
MPSRGKASYPLSFVFGLAFATCWTPCIGPILGSVLTLAVTTPGQAFTLLLAYSLGLGIPFVLMGVFFSRFTGLIRALSRHLKYYSIIMGKLDHHTWRFGTNKPACRNCKLFHS